MGRTRRKAVNERVEGSGGVGSAVNRSNSSAHLENRNNKDVGEGGKWSESQRSKGRRNEQPEYCEGGSRRARRWEAKVGSGVLCKLDVLFLASDDTASMRVCASVCCASGHSPYEDRLPLSSPFPSLFSSRSDVARRDAVAAIGGKTAPCSRAAREQRAPPPGG